MVSTHFLLAMKTYAKTIAALLFLCAACGRPNVPPEVQVLRAPPRSWLNNTDVSERTLAAAEVAVGVWGGVADLLDGYTVTLVTPGKGVECGIGYTTGCTTLGESVRVDVGSLPCVEASALLHEAGHVVISDPHHLDGRWNDAGFMHKMLEAVRTIVPETDEACLDAIDYRLQLTATTIYNG